MNRDKTDPLSGDTSMTHNFGFHKEVRCTLSLFLVAVSALICSGCGTPATDPDAKSAQKAASPTSPTFPGVKLRVAALGNTALGTVTADIVGEWQASRQAEIEIVAAPETNTPTGVDPSVDIWLIRGEKLGGLIDRDILEPLGDLDADWQKRPPVFDNLVGRYGPDHYAVPLGTRVLVMVYREKNAESAAWQQAAQQTESTFPPKTWDEFDKFVGLLKQESPDILAIPTKKSPDDSLPADLFLARVTATGKHRDHFSFLFSAETMEPRIASVPFSDALKALSGLRPKTEMTSEEARAAFRDGKAGLLIDYAENASKWASPQEKDKIGVAPLPGSYRVYEPDRKEYVKMQSRQLSGYLPTGGGYVAVMAKGRSGRISSAAKDFLAYLVSDSTSVQWAADSRMPMCPTRDALLAAGFVDPRIAPKVESGAWGESVLTQLTSDNPVVGLRIPETSQFMDDLENAVIEGLHGKAAEEVLKTASDSWSARVKKFGQERMRWHYRRSLVRPVTDPTPPPAGNP